MYMSYGHADISTPPPTVLPDKERPPCPKTSETCWTKALVGGWPTPLKNMSSSVGMIIPYMKWKIIQPCLKPPTRWFFNAILDDGIPCYQYLIPHMLMVLGIWWSNWLEYSWAPNVGFPNDPAATLRLSQPQTTAAGCWWSAASWPQSAHGAPHVGAVAVHAENLSC